MAVAVALSGAMAGLGGLLVGCPDGLPPGPGADTGPRAAAGPDGVVARWDGGEVALDELEDELASALRELDISYRLERYEMLYRALDARVESQLLAEEQARRGLLSRAALMEAVVAERVAEPSEEELRLAFERFSVQVPSATFEAARPHLARQLQRQRREAALAEYVDELEERAGLELSFPYPDIPRVEVALDGDDPVVGPDDAPVTIVQFAGYQCYYCRKVSPVLARVVADHPGAVRVVSKDFPLTGHDQAWQAATAAHCAHEQGRWQQMSDLLFANQNRLGVDHLRRYAEEVDLDLEAFEMCLRDDVWRGRIEADVRAGREAGVTSTPTFFVNGLMLTGAQDYARFDALVEQELVRLGRR